MAITNAKVRGRLFLLQIETVVPGTYATIGGIRSKGFTLNNEEIDITDGDDDAWKKLLTGGVQSVSVSGSGLVTDETNYKLLKSSAQTNTFKNFRLSSGPGTVDTLTALFQITSLEENGEYNGAQQFSISLSSADTPAFVAGA